MHAACITYKVYKTSERNTDGLFMDLMRDFNADANFAADLLFLFFSPSVFVCVVVVAYRHCTQTSNM